VTRVLSGAVLLLVAIAVVWFATPLVLLIVAEILVVLACHEYAGLARSSRLDVPLLSTAAAMLVCASFAPVALQGIAFVPPDVALVLALLPIGALALSRWRGGPDAVASVSAALLPVLYIGLPIGTMVAIHGARGHEALFLMMLTVVVSDTAQYYSGRAFGKRHLAPAISPKKTIEGAVGGFICGALALAVIGRWWLPAVPIAIRAGMGLMVVAFGIAGDLFESMLKRSAGVKDSSALIPGHGGVLDRIDALLFAAPAYYVVLKYV
jgi:phosphatidate cytidylyltransferase